MNNNENQSAEFKPAVSGAAGGLALAFAAACTPLLPLTLSVLAIGAIGGAIYGVVKDKGPGRS